MFIDKIFIVRRVHLHMSPSWAPEQFNLKQRVLLFYHRNLGSQPPLDVLPAPFSVLESTVIDCSPVRIYSLLMNKDFLLNDLFIQ